MLVIKRKPSSDKCIENYADAPYIGFDALVSLSSDDFRTGIVGRSAASFKLRVGRLKSGHSPISDFNQLVLGTVNKNVFGLEVPVCNRKCMAVGKTMYYLFEIC